MHRIFLLLGLYLSHRKGHRQTLNLQDLTVSEIGNRLEQIRFSFRGLDNHVLLLASCHRTSTRGVATSNPKGPIHRVKPKIVDKPTDISSADTVVSFSWWFLGLVLGEATTSAIIIIIMAVVNFDLNNSTSSQDAINYLEQRGRTSDLRELSITELLNEDGMESVIGILLQNTSSLHLEVLKLQRNFLTASSCQALAHVLQSVPTLRELDVSDNKLGEFNDELFVLSRRESTGSLSSQQSRVSRASATRMKSSLTGDGLVKLVEALAQPSCHLVTLQLSNNKLGKKAATALTGLIRRASSVRHLHLANNNLGTQTMRTLVPALLENDTLETLDLGYNHISDRGASLLASILGASIESSASSLASSTSSICRLQELNLAFNKIGPAGAKSLAVALLNNRTLRKLDLSLNRIGPEGAEYFGPVLKFSHTLQDLILSRNNLGEGTQGILRLLDGLCESEGTTRLQTLDLSWNSLTDDAALKLASILSGNSQLRRLNLASNAIGSNGIIALADALAYDVALRELNMVGNQADDKSAEALAKVLCRPSAANLSLLWEKNNFSLHGQRRIQSALAFRKNMATWLGRYIRDIEKRRVVGLDLQDYVLGDDELVALSASIVRCKPIVKVLRATGLRITSRSVVTLARDVINPNVVTLERLYLDQTSIKDFGSAALAQALLINTSLRVLSLTNCGMTAEGARMMGNALRRNDHLQVLSLQGNAIGDAGACEILTAVLDKPHPVVTSLNLSFTGLSDRGLLVLLPFQRLEYLSLSHNQITDAGALDIAKALIGCTSLKWLDLSNNMLTCRGAKALNLFLPTEATALLCVNQSNASNGYH